MASVRVKIRLRIVTLTEATAFSLTQISNLGKGLNDGDVRSSETAGVETWRAKERNALGANSTEGCRGVYGTTGVCRFMEGPGMVL